MWTNIIYGVSFVVIPLWAFQAGREGAYYVEGEVSEVFIANEDMTDTNAISKSLQPPRKIPARTELILVEPCGSPV